MCSISNNVIPPPHYALPTVHEEPSHFFALPLVLPHFDVSRWLAVRHEVPDDDVEVAVAVDV